MWFLCIVLQLALEIVAPVLRMEDFPFPRRPQAYMILRRVLGHIPLPARSRHDMAKTQALNMKASEASGQHMSGCPEWQDSQHLLLSFLTINYPQEHLSLPEKNEQTKSTAEA